MSKRNVDMHSGQWMPPDFCFEHKRWYCSETHEEENVSNPLCPKQATINALVRAYIISEIRKEASEHAGEMAVRALGEPIANHLGPEAVIDAAMGIVRELEKGGS